MLLNVFKNNVCCYPSSGSLQSYVDDIPSVSPTVVQSLCHALEYGHAQAVLVLYKDAVGLAHLQQGGVDVDGVLQCAIYLIPSEEYLEPLAKEMRSWGYDITWDPDDANHETLAAPQSYRLSIVDQDNVPLSGVILNFCMDTTCTTL